MTPEGGIVMDDRIADMSPRNEEGNGDSPITVRTTMKPHVGSRFGDGVRVDRAVFGARGRCDASGGVDRNDILRVIDAWR